MNISLTNAVSEGLTLPSLSNDTLIVGKIVDLQPCMFLKLISDWLDERILKNQRRRTEKGNRNELFIQSIRVDTVATMQTVACQKRKQKKNTKKTKSTEKFFGG